MDVKPGYKQTEAGMIPEDWEVKSAYEFAAIKTGPFGTLLKASEYSKRDGVPLISVGEIREGFVRISDHTPRVPEVVTRRLPQFILRRGDIVFGRKGGVERSALIRQPQEGWFLGSDGISIRPSQDCHDEYLALQFRSARVQGWLLQNAIGTTMPSLNQEILRNVVIPLPPTKAEQEAIAEALSDADALIESLDQLLAKKRQIKQGAMQELLTGKRRLPGFSGEWKPKRLGEVSEIVMGQSPSSAHYNDRGEGLPLIQGNADISSRQTIRRVFTTEVTKRGYPGDILISVRAPVGEISRTGFDVCLGRGVCAIRCPENDFLYYALIAREQAWAKLSKGSTFDSVSSTDVEQFEIEQPIDETEQHAIAAILSDMDAEIAALETKLAKARQIKQGMMQELLTGRIRLI
ncbi:MAG: restriction endonuclease subunit S [Gammaproteobacteria bacterium]|nr:restriction endonuclease subunit S [Gammaproteobacteria bacterium]